MVCLYQRYLSLKIEQLLAVLLGIDEHPVSKNIIKINNEHISNSNTLHLFNNKITFDNLEFKDEIYIGIRPEDISLKSNHEIQVDVKVDLVENLGFEKIIYSKVSENQIIIKSSENINNHSLKISFSKDKVLFFDKDKNRIR